MLDQIRTAITHLPHAPGVYLFTSKDGAPIYIGKAKDLRARVMSYTRAHTLSPGKRRMTQEAHRLDHVITHTEDEALLLENTLIKQHKPTYNVLLKDDKNFRYIRIDWSEDFPRLATVRRIADTHARYYGPYTSGKALNRMLKLVGRTFKVRDCRLNLRENDPNTFIERPCLRYDLGRCTAPCVPSYIDRETYAQQVRELESFLRGDTSALVQDLAQSMEHASSNKEFERAAIYRDKIKDIGTLIGTQQDVVHVPFKHADIIAIHAEGTSATAARFVVRHQSLIARETYALSRQAHESPEELMEAFVLQFYSSSQQLPNHLFVAALPLNATMLETWLSTRAGSLDLPFQSVRISQPSRGARKRLIDLAYLNAKEAHETAAKAVSTATATAQHLQEALQLPRLPERIECIDISHTQNALPVASLVVFEQGKPAKDQYRRFKIRHEDAAFDDTRRMAEVIKRRFAHTWPLPDLLVLDGGIPQLNAGIDMLKELHLEHIPLAALAKREELVFRPHTPEPIRLEHTSDALRLLMHLRNEAHRFAITFQRKRRATSAVRSVLDDIPGIGPKTKKHLLATFGSIEGIRRATDDELIQLVGPARTRALRAHL